MDLYETNKEIIRVMRELEDKIPSLESLEKEYYSKYHNLLLHSMERTQALKEAASKKQLAMDPIADKYLDLKYEVRVLLTKKEMLIEIARNFRVLEANIDRVR